MPASHARMADESDSVRRSAVRGRSERIAGSGAHRAVRLVARYRTLGNRGSRRSRNGSGPTKIAGPSAAASKTGSERTRSPSQLGMRTRSGASSGRVMASPRSGSADDFEASPHLFEDGEGAVQLLFGVRRRHDRAEAGLPLRDGRKADSLGEEAALEEAVREFHREIGLAHEDGRDRSLADSGVEPQALQPVLE